MYILDSMESGSKRKKGKAKQRNLFSSGSTYWYPVVPSSCDSLAVHASCHGARIQIRHPGFVQFEYEGNRPSSHTARSLSDRFSRARQSTAQGRTLSACQKSPARPFSCLRDLPFRARMLHLWHYSTSDHSINPQSYTIVRNQQLFSLTVFSTTIPTILLFIERRRERERRGVGMGRTLPWTSP